MSKPDELRVIIAGGGTGGHVFPAIAIANALKKRIPAAEILFIGALGRMEMQKVPAAGYQIIGLNIAGIQRRLTLKNLLVPFKLLHSMMRSNKILKQFKPQLVVGVGGYASAPVVNQAVRQGIPVLIQEQNSYPGITNRMLGRKAQKICVAYEGMERFFDKSKLTLTGNPVRSDIINLHGKQQEALKHFGLQPGRPILLVTGGSLGARSINHAVEKHLPFWVDEGIQVIWQTGTHYLQSARQAARKFEGAVSVNPFIDRMDLAYAAADMIVSRAGAIAISEICIVQKAAILVPSPYVAEDHQTKNALALVHHHAAVLVKDHEVEERLGTAVSDLMQDNHLRMQIAERLKGLAFPDAADNIAGVALKMINY